MQGEPTTDREKILKRAAELRDLDSELAVKRAATKETTGGKTQWRKGCVEDHVDPIALALAVDWASRIEKRPKKTTREWRVFTDYLKKLGFFDRLEADLFSDAA